MKRRCPACGQSTSKIMDLPEASVWRCPDCGHEASFDIALRPEEIYTPGYFLETHSLWFANPDLDLYSRIAEMLLVHKGTDQLLIDIGCGTGNFLSFLANKGFSNLHGLDIMDQELPGVVYHREPAETFHSERLFDAAVSLANIEHLTDIEGHMEAMARALRPGGVLAILTVDNQSLVYRTAKLLYAAGIGFAAKRLYDPHHRNHFSTESLARLAGNHGFKRIHLSRRNILPNAVDATNKKLQKAMTLAVWSLNIPATLIGREMLQLSVFQKPE
jgi:2-polyprenyl-3-methyl-5-hydroxy-6-metoxy-1,4-benzoquinol methylase